MNKVLTAMLLTVGVYSTAQAAVVDMSSMPAAMGSCNIVVNAYFTATDPNVKLAAQQAVGKINRIRNTLNFQDGQTYERAKVATQQQFNRFSPDAQYQAFRQCWQLVK